MTKRSEQDNEREEEIEALEEALHPLEALIEQRPLEAVIASVLIGIVLSRILF